MTHTHGYALEAGWKGLLAELGLRHEHVLRRAGLPEDLLNRANARVPAEQFLRFSLAIEEEIGDPAFPVKLVEHMKPEWFSPPLFAALCSPNLAVASERLARFKPLVAPLDMDVDRSGGGLTITYRWVQTAVRPPQSLVGSEALFIVKLARIGTRHEVRPVRVAMPELPEARTAFEMFLGVRLTVGPELQVSFQASDASRPFLTDNHGMWNIFEPELRRRLSDLEGSASFEDRTRAVLLEALPSGVASVEVVARRLAVSPRTLQRRLGEEGTTFKKVVRKTRESLARHYLGQTVLTSAEIAYLLGYDEPTSFFRAFHDWTGTTPETLRTELQPHA